MYALVVVTCLTSGGDCYPALLTDQLPSQQVCYKASQTLAVEYLKDRPERKLESFVCADARRAHYYLDMGRA